MAILGDYTANVKSTLYNISINAQHITYIQYHIKYCS